MKRAHLFALLIVALVLASSCNRASRPGADGASAESGPLAEARALIDQGQPDAALERLKKLPEGPDTLCYQALAYQKKAEAEPAPEAGWKPDELTAIGLLEKAIAAKSDHALAHRTLADLLAPHALAEYGPQAARSRHKAPKAAAAPEGTDEPTGPDATPAPDATLERVVAEYKAALAADKTGLDTVEALIRFAREAGRLDDAEFAFRERIQRQRERPEPYIAFGDFLAQDRKEPMRAIEQYNLALVWQADSVDAKNRIADIYLGLAEDHFDKKEYMASEARLAEAQKYVTDPQSYQAARIHEIQGKLRRLRN